MEFNGVQSTDFVDNQLIVRLDTLDFLQDGFHL